MSRGLQMLAPFAFEGMIAQPQSAAAQISFLRFHRRRAQLSHVCFSMKRRPQPSSFCTGICIRFLHFQIHLISLFQIASRKQYCELVGGACVLPFFDMVDSHWPGAAASHGFRHDDNHSWTWNLDASHESAILDDSGDDDEMPSLAPIEPDDKLWICAVCSSADWRRFGDGWMCTICGSSSFRDLFANQSAGPRPPPPPPHGATWTQPSRSFGHQKPDDPGPYYEPNDYGERAESERPTTDPCVEPDRLSVTTRGSRRQRRAARRNAPPADECPEPPIVPSKPGSASNHSHRNSLNAPAAGSRDGSQSTGIHGKWRDQMLKRLTENTEPKPWDISKGPSPGVKYRGGTPPLPPPWA